MENQKFERQKALLYVFGTIEVGILTFGAGAINVLEEWFSYIIVIVMILSGIVGYGMVRVNRKMKELSGEKKIEKREKEKDVAFKDEIFEFIDTFHTLCNPSSEYSIYNFINKLNSELRDKGKSIFSEEYTTSSMQETASRYKNLEARYEAISKEKVQVVLFLNEFTSLIESHYLFVKNIEQFVENNRIEITSNLKKQYQEKFRDKYNEFFIGYKGFAKRIYDIYEEKKNIPDLKAPHIG